MPRVALIYQPMVQAALELARRCQEPLAATGLEPSILSSVELTPDARSDDLQIALTFGGDGTILRTARWLAGANVPVIGVQMGRLGFLAELLPSEIPSGLKPYLDGDCWLDRRSMLEAELVGAAPGPSPTPPPRLLALNDVVVARGASLRSITVDVSTDGHLLRQFRCDGLIVATATGSTAYSFAAGGPVLAPDSLDLVVTPVCPHISAVRSVVLPSDTALRLQVWTPQPAVLTADGQIDQPLGDGQVVHARLSTATTTFARRSTRAELYARILAKLG